MCPIIQICESGHLWTACMKRKSVPTVFPDRTDPCARFHFAMLLSMNSNCFSLKGSVILISKYQIFHFMPTHRYMVIRVECPRCYQTREEAFELDELLHQQLLCDYCERNEGMSNIALLYRQLDVLHDANLQRLPDILKLFAKVIGIKP